MTDSGRLAVTLAESPISEVLGVLGDRIRPLGIETMVDADNFRKLFTEHLAKRIEQRSHFIGEWRRHVSEEEDHGQTLTLVNAGHGDHIGVLENLRFRTDGFDELVDVVKLHQLALLGDVMTDAAGETIENRVGELARTFEVHIGTKGVVDL